MNSKRNSVRKLDLLALVGQKKEVTFAEVNEMLYDRKESNELDVFYLYDKHKENSLLWAFYNQEVLDLIVDLLDTEALVVVESPTSSYAFKVVPKELVEKFQLLFACENWCPTVLKKGPNYKKEWERLNHDTSE